MSLAKETGSPERKQKLIYKCLVRKFPFRCTKCYFFFRKNNIDLTITFHKMGLRMNGQSKESRYRALPFMVVWINLGFFGWSFSLCFGDVGDLLFVSANSSSFSHDPFCPSLMSLRAGLLTAVYHWGTSQPGVFCHR